MSFQIRKSRDMDAWNHGLGCRERDVKETLRRVEGETGKRFVEMGNEKAEVGPSRAGTYRISEKEMREIHNRLGDAGVPS